MSVWTRLARLLQRSSYRIKVPFLVIAVSVVTALVISTTIAVSARTWLEEDLQNHAQAVLHSLAPALAIRVVRDDVWEAFEAIQAVAAVEGAEQDRDLVVLDRDQRIFASSDPAKFALGGDTSALSEPLRHAVSLPPEPPGTASHAKTRLGEDASLVLRMPLVAEDGQIVGVLLARFSHRLLSARYADTVWTVTLISLVVCASLAPVGWWLGHRLASPMARATEALHRLAQEAVWQSNRYGRPTTDANVPGLPPGSELERLAHSVAQLELQLRDKEQLQQKFVAAELEKQQAEMASRAKSKFLAHMSHELRTPLQAILGFTQLLKRDPGLGERQSRQLQAVEESGEHLLRLIEDALDLAKVEAGKLDLHPFAFTLTDFFERIADTIRVAAQAKGLEFICDLAADLPAAVNCDAKRLRQVVFNLLSNAIKFTNQGSLQMRVTCLQRLGHQATLRIEVKDSGVGIAENQLAAIFLPFEQVGDVTRRAYGTGLGLAIGRQLVQLMGSDIQVASQLGRGSRFWFDIDVPVFDEQPVSQPASKASQATGYLGPRKTILIVDDVAANRALLGDLFGSLGFQTIEAENGHELLRQADLTRPDLIIAGVLKEPLDGLEAIRQLRHIPHLATVPVIALSADVSSASHERSLVASANAFLRKPTEVDELLQQVADLLLLQWSLPSSAPATGSVVPLCAPPQEEMDVLYHLARSGNMRRLCERADHLRAMGSEYAPFADRLQALAEGFKSRAIMDLVSSFRSQADGAPQDRVVDR